MAGIQDSAGTASASAPSAFAQAAANLLAMGFHPIPILPRDKAPGEVTRGEWRLASDWQRFRDRAPTAIELGFFNAWTGANVGVVMGSRVTVAGQSLQVIGVDVDTDDYDMLQSMERALPRSPVRKRGRKGFTAFYLAAPEFKTRRFAIGPAGAKKVIAEFLTGNATRQTVVPPSLHPAGIAYRYETAATLENTRADSLPIFSEDHCAQFLEALESIGWNAQDAETLPTAREVRGVEGENVFREMNNTALANLEAWVGELPIPKLKHSGSGYTGVAFWRPSSTGRNLAQRNPNLGINASGIRDFGTGLGYSALDLVQAVFGLSFNDAFRWLGTRLGTLIEAQPMTTPKILFEAPAVSLLPPHDPETGEIIETLPAPPNRPAVLEAPRPARSAVEALGLALSPVQALKEAMALPPDGELPDRLTRVPGLLGDITEWIDLTARRPNRGLALAASVSFLSVVFGRHYASPTDARTNNYVVGLAPTGSGKQHPLTQVVRLATACGTIVEGLIGPEDTMSLSSLVSVLQQKPSVLFMIDEIGGYFGKILNPRSSSHERRIKDILLTLFGKANIMWGGIEYASKKAVPIYNPNLCIFGMSTKEEFYKSVGDGNVENGFLNRLLVLSCGKSGSDREPQLNGQLVPHAIIEQIKLIVSNRGLNASASSTIGVDPIRATWGLEGQEAWRACLIEIERIMDEKPGVAAFFARTAEHALKLATIRAVGVDWLRPAVTGDDMLWGQEIALNSAFRMAVEATDLISSNPWEEAVNRVLRAIKEAKGTAAHNVLYRKVYRKINPKMFEAIISAMIDAGKIDVGAPVVTQRGGFAPKVYTLRQDA